MMRPRPPSFLTAARLALSSSRCGGRTPEERLKKEVGEQIKPPSGNPTSRLQAEIPRACLPSAPVPRFFMV